MNAQNPDTTPVDTETPKKKFRNPLKKSASTTDTESVDTTSVKDKVKTGLAYVGLGAVVAGGAVYFAKRRGIDEVTFETPDVTVTTDAD